MEHLLSISDSTLSDDQTLMSIEHALLPPDSFDKFQNGWAGVCERLAGHLASIFRDVWLVMGV